MIQCSTRISNLGYFVVPQIQTRTTIDMMSVKGAVVVAQRPDDRVELHRTLASPNYSESVYFRGG